MTLTKRIVMFSVCTALLIASAFINVAPKTLAGAGSGKNEKITNLSELNNLIDSVGRASENQTIALLNDTEPVEKNQYESFTMTEKTSLFTESSSGSAEVQFSLNRTLGMYYTKEGVWYKSEGRLASRTYQNSKSSKMNMDFKIQICLKDNSVMLYIENFQYTYTQDGESSSDTTMSALQNYTNRWIDCTSEPYIAKSFLTVNSSNLQSLSDVAKLIETAIDDEAYTKSGEIYKFSNDLIRDFFDIPNDAKKFEGNFSVDLGNKQKPVLMQTCLAEWDFSYSNTKIYSYIYLNDEVQFKNINNTVFSNVSFNAIDINEIEKSAEA